MTRTPAFEAVVGGPAGGPRRILVWILKFAAAALVLWLAVRMASRIGWEGLAERLTTADPLLTATGIALLVVRYLAWGIRWGRAARHFEESRRAMRRFWAVCASVLINHATPSIRIFGSLLRARYLARGGRASVVPQYAVVLYEQMVHMIVSTAIFWLAGTGIAWLLGFRLAAGASLAAGLAGLAWLFHRRRRGRRWRESPWLEITKRRIWSLTHRLPPLAMHGRELVGDVARLIADRSLRPSVVLWTVVFSASNLGAQWVLFHALGLSVSPFAVAGVIGAGTVVGALTGSPGGLATTEAAMTAGYVALGVGQVDAAAATLLYRGLHYLVVLGCGAPALFYFEIIERRNRPSGL
jgi:uncharacterized protein (TIRG00374 family)